MSIEKTTTAADASALASSDVLGLRLIEALGLPKDCASITLTLKAGQPVQVDVNFFTQSDLSDALVLAAQGYELKQRAEQGV